MQSHINKLLIVVKVGALFSYTWLTLFFEGFRVLRADLCCNTKDRWLILSFEICLIFFVEGSCVLRAHSCCDAGSSS